MLLLTLVRAHQGRFRDASIAIVPTVEWKSVVGVVTRRSETRFSMSGINGVGNSGSVQRIVGPAAARPGSAAGAAAAKSGSTDKLELSGMSHLLKSLKNNDVRTDKVASVRGEIEAGTYEDDRKLEAAIDRLLEELDR